MSSSSFNLVSVSIYKAIYKHFNLEYSLKLNINLSIYICVYVCIYIFNMKYSDKLYKGCSSMMGESLLEDLVCLPEVKVVKGMTLRESSSEWSLSVMG